ncbi:hypothetical protein Hanom_Chr00s000081g01619091 [Helianthus anomalus]
MRKINLTFSHQFHWTLRNLQLGPDPPVIVEDADSLDDESEDTNSAHTDAVIKEDDIPLENHILCDPPAKPAKTVLVKSIPTQDSDNVNFLYTLVGDDRVYSNKDLPIKNVNQSLISKILESSTIKFLGESSSRVVVTQCPPFQKLKFENNMTIQNYQQRKISKTTLNQKEIQGAKGR